jgi:acyl dehydratase
VASGRVTSTVRGADALRALAGRELGPSGWIEMGQDRIDAFARCTEDTQWIHTNRERAEKSVFGTTIAHGFLTLSLLIRLWDDTVDVEGFPLVVNYGLDRVRFPAPVPSGSRIRARFRVVEVTDVAGGVQARIEATAEREGHEKPVCVAGLLLRFLS